MLQDSVLKDAQAHSEGWQECPTVVLWWIGAGTKEEEEEE